MTVGLVIVSHSEKLASGIAELASQMTQGSVTIMAAGGAGNNVIGTSVDTIQQAIEQAQGADGVLVLLDMGSAILSTEMALEMIDDRQRGEVQLTFAPIVEGALAAALEASLGRPLPLVRKAAENAANKQQLRTLKPIEETADLDEPSQASPDTASTASTEMQSLPDDALEKQFVLDNPAGLHARPASLIIQKAGAFNAQVEIRANGRTARANSLIELLGLSARRGTKIIIRSRGQDAQHALDALSELVQANFYESDEVGEPLTPQVKENTTGYTAYTTTTSRIDAAGETRATSNTNEIRGVATSKGLALGAALLYASPRIDLRTIETHSIDESQVVSELARLQRALAETLQDLHELATHVSSRTSNNEAAIFEAQSLLLHDPLLLTTASDNVRQHHFDAASAFAQAGEQYAAQIEHNTDALIAERAVDIRDVASRVVRHLGVHPTTEQRFDTLSTPVILVANDLTPSDTAQLRREMILGICTVQGGPTAHTAILARALGIPAIAGFDVTLLQQIHNGDEIGMDADNGVIYLHPTGETRAYLIESIARQQRHNDELKEKARQTQGPLVIDGQKISLLANIGSAVEADAARQWGAEGVGLLRTEFLFASAQTMPGEDEQYASFVSVFRAFRGSSTKTPVIVARTLDAGADKPLPALQPYLTTAEANPALGVRGIRIHLAHPELLEQQFRAMIRAAEAEHIELHIMVPMITTVEELRSVRQIFERVSTAMHIMHPPMLGIMVEVPASVVMAPELAQLADFFSIGANDLLQYTLACDRTNTALATLYNPLQPSVLRLIRQIATAGRNAGKAVAVCGEMASDPRIAPILVGLGVTELSMTPNALPAIRAALTGYSFAVLQKLADNACAAATVADVEHAYKEYIDSRQ